MSEDQDKSQKTEEPTHKRLEEALKKGQVASSREVNSFLLLFCLALVVMWMAPSLMVDAKQLLAPFIVNPDDMPTSAGGLGDVLMDLIQKSALIIMLPLLATMVAAITGGLLQHPPIFTVEPIIPKWEKVSIGKGIDRLFSRRSLVEFFKGIIKITLIGIIAFMAVWPDMGRVRSLPGQEMSGLLVLLSDMSGRMLIGVCVAMFFIAILDLLYQRFEFIKNLRMSKQEIKDEYKQQEGDPMIKQRLRSLRMERARKRMMAAVPTSDVVITNPTHFAVALTYDSGVMRAPVVVAKGADVIAFNIRKVAKEHDVPIVENPPLARSLYDTVELDQEIPIEQFKAVAEVISYVYRLKGKKPPKRGK